uniref:Uncharacterized protein n=1 Tax=Anguilla anguilla TaxID=7936 RepID=A0A0E9RMS1_ANGAN
MEIVNVLFLTIFSRIYRNVLVQPRS